MNAAMGRRVRCRDPSREGSRWHVATHHAGMIERGLEGRLAADTVGRIDPPAEPPKMGRIRHEEVADGRRHSRGEQH